MHLPGLASAIACLARDTSPCILFKYAPAVSLLPHVFKVKGEAEVPAVVKEEMCVTSTYLHTMLYAAKPMSCAYAVLWLLLKSVVHTCMTRVSVCETTPGCFFLFLVVLKGCCQQGLRTLSSCVQHSVQGSIQDDVVQHIVQGGVQPPSCCRPQAVLYCLI
jgi:hypothetical protein